MKMLMLGSGSYKSSLTYFRLVSLAKELAKHGYDIRLVLPSADKYNNYTPDKSARIDGITLVQPWQPVTKKDIVNFIPYLFTALAACLRVRPQIIFIDKPTPISIIGLIPKLLFRVPMVLDLDDLGSEVMRLEQQSPLQVKLVALSEKLALRFADAVVVTSTFLEATVRAQYPLKPVLVLSNGVDPEAYPVVPVKDVRNTVYYYGALNRLQLIDSFLKALPETVRQVPDTKVVILGSGKALHAAKQRVAELGVAERVFFNGWTKAEELVNFIREGDIAICTQPDIPTVRAASNLKVFQYMSLGSVSIVSDVGDLADYVKYRQQGRELGMVVPPDDSQALAEALIKLLRDKKGRRRMMRLSRQAAETEYAWPTLAGSLDTFMRETLMLWSRHAR